MDKVFEDIHFSDKNTPVAPLEKGKYDNCVFQSCDFSNQDLSDIVFVECSFEACDLTMTKIIDTAFRDVMFSSCKLLGVAFDSCNNFLLSLNFEKCELNLVSFQGLKLKGTIWKNCSLKEADFTNADLTKAAFKECDLERAIFDSTNLESADFRKAYNYTLDPENNRVKGARFSSSGLTGLVEKYKLRID